MYVYLTSCHFYPRYDTSVQTLSFINKKYNPSTPTKVFIFTALEMYEITHLSLIFLCKQPGYSITERATLGNVCINLKEIINWGEDMEDLCRSASASDTCHSLC